MALAKRQGKPKQAAQTPRIRAADDPPPLRHRRSLLAEPINDPVGPGRGRCLRRVGKSNRDEETAGGAGCEVDGPVVCSDDALHDGQPEADPDVFVGARAFCSALEGFGEGR